MSTRGSDEALVSVVLSVYNGEPHVTQAIRSILDQSYQNLELIIIDDGSTDRTVSLVREFSDKRIRLFRQSNVGLTVSLNRGIELAAGAYVARQDADDVSAVDRLDIQIQALDNDAEVGFVGSWARLVDARGRIFGDLRYAVSDSELRDRHIMDNQFAHGSLVFRKHELERIGGYRTAFRFSQDYDLTLRLQERCKAANMSQYLYHLRHVPSKLSYKYGNEQVAYAHLARVLASERRAIGYEVTDVSSGLMPGEESPVARCSYEDEVIYEALRCGYTGVAREYLLSEIEHGRNRLKNGLRLLLAAGGGRLSRTVYSATGRNRKVGVPVRGPKSD